MSEKKKAIVASRRDFLKVAGIGSLGLAAVGNPGLARNAYAAGSDLIKVGLVGCGGRGLGSLKDRAAVKDNMKIVAIGDVIDTVANRAATMLREDEDVQSFLDLPSDRVFGGFDAYKKVTDEADQVLIASPPGFHTAHYCYAVECGKHIFMEKPFCVDAEGYRRCMKANKLAEEKGITVCSGYQRRHENNYNEWVKRLLDGAIGEILNTRVYWNGGGAKVRGVRGEGETEMRFQVRDWYFFNWLSGDHLLEQHCHNLDVGNWIHGKGDPLYHPVSCVGMGGRQVRRTPGFPYNECGNIFDHHYVEYQYPDGTIMHSQCRQIPNCWNSVTEKVQGTNGHGQSCWYKPNNGERWDYKPNKDRSGYVQEHFDQVDAIRSAKKLHDGWHAATSSMIGVMGWMSTYSGKEIKWDDATTKGKTLFPYDVNLTFDTESPVMPGPDGTYEHAVPSPGIYVPFE